MASATTRRGSGRAADMDLFERVRRLALNLHWSWSPDAQRLFAALDPAAWKATNHNPLRTLALMPPERREALRADGAFAALLDACEAQLAQYMNAPAWFGRTFGRSAARMRVAYFCAEYAVHECLPQYSGGLGVLAGDHVKTASDLGVPLVGVGRLYRSGYFKQTLTDAGRQVALYPKYDFEQWPIEDTGQRVAIPIASRTVHARIWQLAVGRTAIYLLDTDIKDNRPADRTLTATLYGAHGERRLAEQIVLGVGGHRALLKLGIAPTVIHLNEGHAAYCALDRVRAAVASGLAYDEAVAAVRATSVFTTHTPVPAGHDRFLPSAVWRYLKPLADEIGLSREQLLGLGREDPGDRNTWFTQTVLALRLSGHCNGVARLHGDTSRRMWQKLYDAVTPKHVPIGHVTNGIHTETWLAPEARPLYDKYLKPKWLGMGPDFDPCRCVERIPPAELWALRCLLRKRLVAFVRQRLREQMLARMRPIEELRQAYEAFDEHALTIGFARRFATYKRAPLVFRDARRLAAILNDAKRPVQLVFAGKAHPADEPGQAFVREVVCRTRTPALRGRVVFIEDYDMHVGRMLTSGCDVWLNTPLRPMEASGTSGMKPPLHGGLNLSVLDGWWPEAYNGRNGWAIGEPTGARRAAGASATPASRAAQDRRDAQSLYELLETRVVPAFYDRGRDGVPRRWVKMMVESMRTVCGPFGAQRMLGEYVERYYLPAHRAAVKGARAAAPAAASGSPGRRQARRRTASL